MVITVKINHGIVLVTNNRDEADELARGALKFDPRSLVEIITEERIKPE